jgi:hypothetical protein
MEMKMKKIGAASLALGLCIWSTQAFAQVTTTTATTTSGAFTEYTPSSHTVVVRSDSGVSPLHYSVTKQTTIVDQSGASIPIERISPGSPLSIEYTGTGDHLVASRIIVQRPAGAAVTEQQTTTTTTRPLTHKEKHALKEAREHPERAEKEAREAQKKALEKEDEHNE